MAQPANYAELAGSFPVFLLGGALGRIHLSVFHLSGGALQKRWNHRIGFDGGLADPNLEERLESVAADMESDGIQIEVSLPRRPGSSG